MRQTSEIIKSRALQNLQTADNNANPTMEVVVTRPRTPIFNKRFWQETIITAGSRATCTSVAVRRMTKFPDKVYVAYVSGGTLTVKSAMITYPIKNMAWNVETTVAGCDSCALEFDGSFKKVGRNAEYYTEDIPWLFYTTISGELRTMMLGSEEFELLSASGVTTLDVVRGISSKNKDIDQGMLVFYIVNNGLFYRQKINGVWEGQLPVDYAPVVPISVKAERLFDYRTCLHVTDQTGALWEIFTKMAASAWNGNEYLTVGTSMAMNVREVDYIEKDQNENITTSIDIIIAAPYALSPVMLSAENYANTEGDYGYFVRLRLDELVFGTVGNEYNFTITDIYNTVWHADTITNNGRELLLQFFNFNNANNPVTIAYTPGTVMGEVIAMAADSLVINLMGLVPTFIPSPVPVSVENIIDWMGVN